MVSQMLAGMKWETRRLIKPQPNLISGAWHWSHRRYDNGAGADYFHTVNVRGIMKAWVRAMPIQVGDRICVREAWAVDARFDSYKPCSLPQTTIFYANEKDELPGRPRPGMFMPRWASRLTLTVVDVSIEQLQEITEAGAIAEGVVQDREIVDIRPHPGTGQPMDITEYLFRVPGTHDDLESGFEYAVDAYKDLWDRLNADRGFSWDKNPWVMVVKFQVHHMNINDMPRAA